MKNDTVTKIKNLELKLEKAKKYNESLTKFQKFFLLFSFYVDEVTSLEEKIAKYKRIQKNQKYVDIIEKILSKFEFVKDEKFKFSFDFNNIKVVFEKNNLDIIINDEVLSIKLKNFHIFSYKTLSNQNLKTLEKELLDSSLLLEKLEEFDKTRDFFNKTIIEKKSNEIIDLLIQINKYEIFYLSDIKSKIFGFYLSSLSSHYTLKYDNKDILILKNYQEDNKSIEIIDDYYLKNLELLLINHLNFVISFLKEKLDYLIKQFNEKVETDLLKNSYKES